MGRDVWRTKYRIRPLQYHLDAGFTISQKIALKPCVLDLLAV